MSGRVFVFIAAISMVLPALTDAANAPKTKPKPTKTTKAARRPSNRLARQGPPAFQNPLIRLIARSGTSRLRDAPLSPMI